MNVKRTLAVCVAFAICTANGLAATAVVVNATNLSDPPTLRCRAQVLDQLSSCAVFLPHGEQLNTDEIMADSKRWETKAETYGKAHDAVVFIKELSDEPNISTTLYLTTDAPDGVYRVLVVADPSGPRFSEVHFSHSLTAAQRQRMLADRASREAELQAEMIAAAALAKQRQESLAALQQMKKAPCSVRVDSKYRWNAGPLAPASVFLDDQNNTCVQLPPYMQTYPAPYVGDVPIRTHPRISDRMLILDGLQGHFQLRAGTQFVQIDYIGK